jgi:uncharacterized protein YndB with AHSA1/START domain
VPDAPVQEAVQGTVRIAAPASLVWRMVSDVTRMPQWSPELIRARWLGPIQEPKVGAKFRGTNRNKFFRWSTTCEVIAADADSTFAYRVTHTGLPIAEWSFDISPTAAGCELTERTVDRRGWFMRTFGGVGTGVFDRTEQNRTGIAATLAALKAAAEKEAAPGTAGG